MRERREFDLLVDIARLLKKYGPDVFDELARMLNQTEVVKNLIAILEDSAGKARSAKAFGGGKRRSSGQRTGLRQLLSELEVREPQKGELLANFNEALGSKSVLPTLKELRYFAMDNGLSPIRATARDKAIYPFLKDLATRPVEEIKSIVNRASIGAQMGDRSLEGWAGVILDKKRSKKVKE